MTPETRILVQYRLDRAREALAEASLLLDRGHANTGMNRLYYECFYAVSALLLTKGLTATSHSGLRTLFHQHLIRPGLLPLGQGPLYDRLFLIPSDFVVHSFRPPMEEAMSRLWSQLG
jgi:uncharacterized protein (UPF0332 family)